MQHWLTDQPGFTNKQVVKQANNVRWQLELFQRELKQLTGSEKCQCPGARAQPSHLALSYQAWLSLKVAATEVQQTSYQLVKKLWAHYLRAELCQPHILALQPPD